MDNNNTVMAHIARLREKMHEPARKPKYVKTVWGWAIPLSERNTKTNHPYRSRITRHVLFQYFLSLIGLSSAFVCSGAARVAAMRIGHMAAL